MNAGRRSKQKRRATGSGPGKLNPRDVGVSAASGGKWSLSVGGVLTFIDMFARDVQDQIPLLAMICSIEVAIGVAAITFILIFVTKLLSQKKSDNRTGSK